MPPGPSAYPALGKTVEGAPGKWWPAFRRTRRAWVVFGIALTSGLFLLSALLLPWYVQSFPDNGSYGTTSFAPTGVDQQSPSEPSPSPYQNGSGGGSVVASYSTEGLVATGQVYAAVSILTLVGALLASAAAVLSLAGPSARARQVTFLLLIVVLGSAAAAPALVAIDQPRALCTDAQSLPQIGPAFGTPLEHGTLNVTSLASNGCPVLESCIPGPDVPNCYEKGTGPQSSFQGQTGADGSQMAWGPSGGWWLAALGAVVAAIGLLLARPPPPRKLSSGPTRDGAPPAAEATLLRNGRRRHFAVLPALMTAAVALALVIGFWVATVPTGNTPGGCAAQCCGPCAQYTVTVGGSRSAYPFDQFAIQQFEQNNSNIVISNTEGGTAAGLLAVCHGAVDIGVASALESISELENDTCPSTAVINIVAYEAVDVIVPVADPHGLVSISSDTLTAIYDGTSTKLGPSLLASSIDSVPVLDHPINVAPWRTHGALAWDQVPACVIGQADCGGAGNPVEAPIAVIGAGIPCPWGVDICAAGGTTSPCGFSVCAGPYLGTAGKDPIQTVARSDPSGTSQTFEARLLGATNAFDSATTPAELGYTGCGPSELLTDCGMNGTITVDGDLGEIAAVAATPDAIGYANDLAARATSSGVSCQGYATSACGIGFEAVGQSAPVRPSLGSLGTIAAEVILGGFGPPGATPGVTSGYGGVCPFEWVTTNVPTGEVARLLKFVMDPTNNLNFAAESGEISPYSI